MLFQNEHLHQGRPTTTISLVVDFGWCVLCFIHFNCIIESQLHDDILEVYLSFI